jgi:hypothetical protein
MIAVPFARIVMDAKRSAMFIQRNAGAKMRKGKLKSWGLRPFKPAGWMIVDHQSGLLQCFGRNRRLMAERIYAEEGGVLKIHDVDAFTVSHRLIRYLERYADGCDPEDWVEVSGFPGYVDLAPD